MDSFLLGNPAKNQIPCGEVRDRISSLPDGILSHMLSFLPAKSAAQTVVLSKRWKHPWLSVAELDFDLDYQADVLKFTQFMDRLVAARGNSSIRKFRLSCNADLNPECICSWMNNIAMCDVEELELNLLCSEVLKWSHLNISGESMKVMKLGFSILIDIPSIISFSSLKILHLNQVHYADEHSIKKLLSSCQVLENLRIERFEWDEVKNFVISVPSVIWLELNFAQRMDHVDSDDYIECRLQIDAPIVEYLKIYDVMSDSIIVSPMPLVTESFVSVTKILECGLTDDQARDNGNNVSALFRSISNVKHLTISDFTMECLLGASDTRLPVFHNLLHLEVTVNDIGGDSATLLPSLLEACPVLETLILPKGMRSPWGGYEYTWRPPNNVPQCLLDALKVVVIRRITGMEGEIELLKYLLENAMILEQMTISCEDYIISGGPYDNVKEKLAADCTLADRFPYRHDLINCARGSAKCQLVLQFLNKVFPFRQELGLSGVADSCLSGNI